MHSAFQSQPQQPTYHIKLTFDRDAYDGKFDSRFLVSIVDLRTNKAGSFRRNRGTRIAIQPKIPSMKHLLEKMIINNMLEYDMRELFSLQVEHQSKVFHIANATLSFYISEYMDTVEEVSSKTVPQFVSSPSLSPIRCSAGKMCTPSMHSPTSVQHVTPCPPPLSLMTIEQQKQAWQI